MMREEVPVGWEPLWSGWAERDWDAGYLGWERENPVRWKRNTLIGVEMECINRFVFSPAEEERTWLILTRPSCFINTKILILAVQKATADGFQSFKPQSPLLRVLTDSTVSCAYSRTIVLLPLMNMPGRNTLEFRTLKLAKSGGLSMPSRGIEG